jgi:hypothetical protein
MNRSRRCALLLLIAVYACPTPAAAHWWDYLEELSGPGPFTTPIQLFRVGIVCFAERTTYVRAFRAVEPAIKGAEILLTAKQSPTTDTSRPELRDLAMHVEDLRTEFENYKKVNPFRDGAPIHPPNQETSNDFEKLTAKIIKDIRLIPDLMRIVDPQRASDLEKQLWDDALIRWVTVHQLWQETAAEGPAFFWPAPIVNGDCSDPGTGDFFHSMNPLNRVSAAPDEKLVVPPSYRPAHFIVYLNAEFLSFTDKELPDNNSSNAFGGGKEIHLDMYKARVSWRPPHHDFVDLGVGIGAYVFRSDGTPPVFETFSGLVLEPARIELHAPTEWTHKRYLTRLAGAVTLNIGWNLFPAGFQPNVFGQGGKNDRSFAGGKWLLNTNLFVDVLKFFPADVVVVRRLRQR